MDDNARLRQDPERTLVDLRNVTLCEKATKSLPLDPLDQFLTCLSPYLVPDASQIWEPSAFDSQHKLIILALAGQPLTKEHGPPSGQKDAGRNRDRPKILCWMPAQGGQGPGVGRHQLLGKGYINRAPSPPSSARVPSGAGERVASSGAARCVST